MCLQNTFKRILEEYSGEKFWFYVRVPNHEYIVELDNNNIIV